MKVFLLRKGSRRRIRRDEKSPTTPPNLLGMERRIAYANRKYHSGTICAGVDIGFAMIKLSGSPSAFGLNMTNLKRALIMTTKPTISLIVKYQ